MAWAIVDSAASGDVTVVAAPSGSANIRVFSYNLIAGGSDTIFFANGNDSLQLTGKMALSTTSGQVEEMFPDGIFETTAGNALLLHKGAAVQVGGSVRYQVYG